MESLFTPRNKKVYIDETIISTPKPQASSTVERKGMSYTRKPKEKIDLDYVPVQESENGDDRSRSSSRLSTQSSLGLLSMDHVDNMQEFSLEPKENRKDSAIKMPHPSDSLTEKLLLQRKLAQKAIDRANSVAMKSVAGLPSYLLKANSTPNRNNTNNTSGLRNEESTVNLSDLEDLSKTGGKISFEAKEISARSSSLGNDSKQVVDLRTPSPNRNAPIEEDDFSIYNAKCQAIFDKIRKSDIQFQQKYNRTESLDPQSFEPLETINISSDSNNSWTMDVQDSLINKLQNELFTPAELAADKLAADEVEWHKEQDTMPIDSPRGKNHLELSCFSGFIGEGDVSSSSRNDEKVSIGQFFQRKSDRVEDLDLKESPEKRNNPIALINSTDSIYSPKSYNTMDSIYDYPRPTPKISEVPLKDPRMSESVMSVTQIAEALANMKTDDTPRKMIDYLMNRKKQTERLKQMSNSVAETLKNSVIETPSKTFQIENKQMELKENLNDSNKFSLNTPHKFNQLDSILSEISNISDLQSKSKNTSTSTLRKDTSTTSTLKHTKDTCSSTLKNNSTKVLRVDSPDANKENLSEKKYPQSKTSRNSSRNSNVQEVITISDDTVDEHSDWKDAKVNFDTPEPNKSLSSLAESPSISCSELEFSEDDPETSCEYQNGLDDCWVRIKQDNEPHRACVLVVYETEVFMSSLSSRWLLYKIKLGQVKVQGDVCSYSDNAIKMKLPDKEELIKQGAEHRFVVQFITYVCGKIELALVIQLTDMVTKKQKEIEHTLIIESEEADISVSKDLLNYDVLPEESRKTLDVTLINSSRVELPVCLAILPDNNIFTFANDSEPSIQEFEVRKKLILTSEAKVTVPIEMFAPTLQDLQCSSHVAELTGKLVIYLETETSKVLKEVQLLGRVGMTKIQYRSSCLPMILTPGQTKVLQMKNSGLVKMDLVATVVENKTKMQDDVFTIDPSVINLKPNQSGQINVTFNPVGKMTGPIYRVLRMQLPGGPTFVCPLEGTSSENSPILCKTPTGRTSLGSSGRNSPRDQCKSASPIQRSGRSSADSGTISYLPNGKLPIETNRIELVWGCVKPGKTQTQEFIIRNRSLQRVRFLASLTGNGFKIVKDQSEQVTSMSMVLHGMESRTIVVSFSPSSIGAATAKLMFTPIESSDLSHVKMQMIFMYGYGGHSFVDVQGVAKDPTGKMWLSFGRLDYRMNLEQSFVLRNLGTLPAFIHLTLCSKALYPFMNTSVKIVPNEAIIPPNKEIEVSVKFTPRQEDFKVLQNSGASEVFEVASLQLVSGPEPTRGRVRKLFSKMNQAGTNSFSADLLSKLCVPFAGEHMPADLGSCKEKEVSSSLKELLQDLTTREVSLTIEHDLEQSLALGPAVDDTCMFQSLCNDTAHLTLDHSQFDNPIRRTSGGFCTIEPTKLMLTPPVKIMDTVLLCSKHSRPMPFEITLASNELQVEPSVGMVPPGQTTVITVSCASSHSKQLQFFKVMVYVENEVMEIEVKVVQVQQRRSITPRR